MLASCAHMLEDQIQELTVVTPGAQDSICYVYVDKTKYRFRPPDTMTIVKSKEDLIVDCLAPGNRRKKVVIQPTISKVAALNAANGVVPGTSWDMLSGAINNYPELVEVDFTNTPTKPEDLPAQNNPDIKQPEEYRLEEFKAGLPRLNSDRYAATTELQRRRGAEDYTGGTYRESYGPETTAPMGSGKGDLMTVIDVMQTDINPSGAQTPPPSSGAPVPLFDE